MFYFLSDILAYIQLFSLDNIISYSTRSANDGTTVPKCVACKITHEILLRLNLTLSHVGRIQFLMRRNERLYIESRIIRISVNTGLRQILL